MNKSTVEEIRTRFDNDVERFSNLETGQQTTIDAAICLRLITQAAAHWVPEADQLLDVGCGAGNYTLKMLEANNSLHCTLLDLSRPMLDRALERVSVVSQYPTKCVQGDIRTASLDENHYDIILAGAVLHHLRDDNDWEQTFRRLYRLLRPGGCLLISDMVTQETEVLNQYIRGEYGHYLEQLGGVPFRQRVTDYIEKEDSPRPVTEQLRLMLNVGFRTTEILHKNLCFAAYGALK